MTELVADNAITPFQAIIWCLYPVGAIVFLELLLRAISGDDDDDDEGGGVMTPVYQGASIHVSSFIHNNRYPLHRNRCR